LVARIEQDADRTGVAVKSPDRIRCKITGRFREVDASIFWFGRAIHRPSTAWDWAWQADEGRIARRHRRRLYYFRSYEAAVRDCPPLRSKIRST